MKKIIFLAIIVLTILWTGGGYATDLQVSKNTSNVILSWTGGSAPYHVVRSTSPLFYYNNTLLADNYFDTQIIDVGALTSTDNFYYDVSGINETPKDESNPAHPVPFITSLDLDYGKPGDTIIINGNNFADIDYDNIVLFGIYRAQVTAASTTQLTVIAPPEVITGFVTVTVDTLTSNEVMFNRLYGANSYSNLSSICFENGNGSVWVGDRGTINKMIEIFPDETQTQLSGISEIIISNIETFSNTWIYYGSSLYSSSNIGRISRLEVVNNTTELFRNIGSTSDPVQVLAITPDTIDSTVIFVSDGYRRSIRRVPKNGSINSQYGGLSNLTFTNPSGLRCDGSGNLWATTFDSLIKIAPDQSVSYEVTGLNGAAGIDITESMGFPEILMAEKNTGKIYLYNSVSKLLVTIANGLNSPVGVAFSEDLSTGELYYEVLEPTKILKLPDPKIKIKLKSNDRRVLIHKYDTWDKYPSLQQTEDRKIKIEVQLQGYKNMPSTVYFRLKDPKDESPYASGSENDNQCGSGNLDATSSPVDANGIASVNLVITDRCAGDNYLIEISLENNFSKIEAKTPVLEAWKRIYIEKDRMYKEGRNLSADSGPSFPPANYVRISDT